MSERKVNLYAIIREKWVWLLEEPARELIHDIAKEACRQALELAAENATTIDDPDSYCGNTGSEYPPDIIVNKQSIINTINQVE